MLDSKDKIILEALFQDATITSKDLAKLARITQPAAYNRVKKLEEEGYIWRYDCILNWNVISLRKKQYFCNLVPELLRKIEAELFVLALFETVGQYSHSVWCFFKTKEQEIAFESLLPDVRREVVITSVYTKPLSLFDNSISVRNNSVSKLYSFTREDIIIFKALSSGGAKKSVMNIYEETGLSIDVIRYRKKRMITENVISYFLAQPGIAKMQLTVTYMYIYSKKRVDLTKQSRVIFYFEFEGGQGVGFISKDLTDYLAVVSYIASLYQDELSDLVINTNKAYHVLNRYPLELLLS